MSPIKLSIFVNTVFVGSRTQDPSLFQLLLELKTELDMRRQAEGQLETEWVQAQDPGLEPNPAFQMSLAEIQSFSAGGEEKPNSFKSLDYRRHIKL